MWFRSRVQREFSNSRILFVLFVSNTLLELRRATERVLKGGSNANDQKNMFNSVRFGGVPELVAARDHMYN